FPLPALPVELVDPVLIPAARGSAWLVTGSAGERGSYRFFPWESRFVPNPDPPSALPPQEALAVDPGAFVWSTSGKLFGVRSDVRQSAVRAIGPRLLTQPALGTTIVPTAPPSFDDAAQAVSFTGSGLGLRGFGSVWISDATYAGFELELGGRTGPPPRVLLQVVDDA